MYMRIAQYLLALLVAAEMMAAVTNPTADQIIEANIKARGGREALTTIRSLSFTGTRVGDGHTGQAAKYNMRPSYFLVGCTQPTCSVAEGYDEKGAWELSPRLQRVMRVDEAAGNALRRAAEFDDPYIDYAKQGNKVRLIGKTTFHDRPAYAIEIQYPWELREIHYFDAETHLDLGNRTSVKLHARGADLDSVTYYDEYRPVNGFLMPYRQEWVRLDTGEQLELVHWEKIEANTIEDPNYFRPPAVSPGPATMLSMEMYEKSSRATAEELVAMYNSFREKNPTIATEQDLNWLGYELLKKERFDKALAVFNIVLKEKPQSANAYDSLGDAYEQMGHKKDAMAAFQKVLALDPNAKASKAKLERLEAGSPP
jgi:tetratricopeptide (TPR) repeat protein